MFEANPHVADLLCGLNKSTANIMVANNAELKRGVGFLGKAERGRNAAIGHGNDDINISGCFLREALSHTFAHVINAFTADNAVRTREINKFKYARAGL